MTVVTFAALAGAVVIPVNCNLPGTTIGGVLKRLDPANTNVVNVSGDCRENLVIRGFDRLYLIASPGAVLEDASGGHSSVIYIGDSRRAVVRGFTIRAARAR